MHRTQNLGPKQPASGSGEPRKRLKLRSAMHNYVSCLGMTTHKVSASVRVPTHQQKRFSLWGSGDISFWQAQKEMPPEIPRRLSKGGTYSPGTMPSTFLA